MKKTIALLLAFILVVGVTIGGTIAWLTAQTPEVKNTFTVGDIGIELWEHKLNPDNDKELTNETVPSNEYNYVPGDTLPKDPFVTVKAGSEACWLFINVTEDNNGLPDSTAGEKIISWTVAEGWTQVDNHNVWYKEVDAATAKTGESWYILAGDTVAEGATQKYPNGCVTVNTAVTKDMVTTINADKPTLTFDAYAHQSANTTLEAAKAAALTHFGITTPTT